MLVVDASDAMPAGIGTDLFWDLITRWIADTITYDELATALDEAMATATGDTGTGD